MGVIMAIRVTDEFGSRANPPSSAYPDGSLKNETNPGVSNDGSPLDERVGNDWEGFKQSVLFEGAVAANGNPDSVDNPQILGAMKNIQKSHAPTYTDIVYKESGGNSAVDNMISGIPIETKIGDICSTGGTSWKRKTISNPSAPSDFAAITSVRITDFGVVGDGVTNERDKLASAIIAAEGGVLDLDNMSIKFSSDVSLRSGTTIRNGNLVQDTGYLRMTNGDCKLENVRFTGNTAVGCYISGSNYTIDRCTFDGSAIGDSMGQVILLFNGSYITIKNCIFRQCIYSIIQQAGFAFNNVLIDGNHCYESKADFVEANSANVDAENWTIVNNFFTGGFDFPVVETENRFVGITQVKNVIISNNTVQNVNGDAPVHLEDTLGDVVVSGNVFENWNSNQGCVYILSSSKDTVVSNNIFVRSRSDALGVFCISDQSNTYTGELTISGNFFYDRTGEKLLIGCRMAAGSNCTINSNTAIDCNSLAWFTTYNKAVITGNKTENCISGIRSNCDEQGNSLSPSGASLRQAVVSGNFINLSTDNNAAICFAPNTNGTGGAFNVLITGNNTNGKIGFTGTSTSSNTENNVITANFVTQGGSYAAPSGTTLTPDPSGNYKAL